MKIHEVVPLDKNLKRKVLDFCRERRTGRDLIYLGKGPYDNNNYLCVKYNCGAIFGGLCYHNDTFIFGRWDGSDSSSEYFAFYNDFNNKSIVQKPAKPKKQDNAAEPDSLTTRLIRVEQKLDTLLKTMNNLTLKVEK